jgi:hypothetical protein
MTSDNYEKFRTAFNQKGDKKQFYLQEWGKTKVCNHFKIKNEMVPHILNLF